MDCGPACLRMIAHYHGKEYSLEYLRESCHLSKAGVSLSGISDAAEKIGFRTVGIKVGIKKLIEKAPMPCILHWNQNHFVVLRGARKNSFYIADPAAGTFKLNRDVFLKGWLGDSKEGIALLLEPTVTFYDSSEKQTAKKGFKLLFRYLRSYLNYILQLFLSLIIGSAISLILPFLTQSLVDYGINKQNLDFVQLILISQLILFGGSLSIEILRSWLMLHMNSRVNIAIISDFLAKMMRLPMRFFDSKQIGDIKQRLADQARIQSFLTGPALSSLFSMINLVVFTVVIAFYSAKILIIFSSFSVLSVIWILIFLKRRKRLDYIRFQRASTNENVVYELITGMQEIKLNNSETSKRWGWERVQAKLFELNIKSLSLSQTQQVGSSFFNQLKSIIISYVSAKEVINGSMTLGMMMSISYIIGQMNNPIQQIIGLIQSAQDAKISLDRLSEIYDKEDEEQPGQRSNLSLLGIDEHELTYSSMVNDIIVDESTIKDNRAVTENGIELNNVSFQYQGSSSPFALKNIFLKIPEGKVTAIVGMSGSGKTTLMKLLLKYYKPTSGEITVNGIELESLSPKWWRSKCGAVTQEGYIFNDSVAGNISVGDHDIDNGRLKQAVTTANIQEFIEGLPMGYLTQIGANGVGVSAGQKQRILIARAVYKNPDYLFFDEATNTLDANNERVIMENLNAFFSGKTVVIIAHRLSTVKNADQIVVLDSGEIVEHGIHTSLINRRGRYFELVKNQLELDV